MYNVFKTVITNGNYELTDMLKKIDVQWVQGTLTDEERVELIALAQKAANIQNSVDVIKKLEEFDKRLKALENANADKGAEGAEDGKEDTSDVQYDEYVSGKWYYNGDAVRFEDSCYICTAPEGQVCVWSPIEYPVYWQQVT